MKELPLLLPECQFSHQLFRNLRTRITILETETVYGPALPTQLTLPINYMV